MYRYVISPPTTSTGSSINMTPTGSSIVHGHPSPPSSYISYVCWLKILPAIDMSTINHSYCSLGIIELSYRKWGPYLLPFHKA